MSTQNGQSHIGRKRRVIRRDWQDYAPFIPWGIIPFLGLIVLFLYGLIVFSSASIQDTARASARDALAGAGADWAKVKASGQWITIEGNAPSTAAVATAVRAVEERTSSTWLGGKSRPITIVRDNTTVGVSPSTPAPTPAASIEQSPHNWTYTLDRSILDLTGDVPDQATRDAIVDIAGRSQASPRFVSIRDNLIPTGRPAPEGYIGTALRGINTLSRCEAGSASFIDNVFSLNCEAEASIAGDIRREANAQLSYGSFGRIDVYSAEDANTCNQNMVDLLSETRIEFATSSAVIDPTSVSLLNRVAEAAQACPGKLSIGGHTDNTGRAGSNERLSRQRAEAVRRALIDRGIAAGRLEASGYGASRPIADNSTEFGRARNRRIEIQVIRLGTSPR